MDILRKQNSMINIISEYQNYLSINSFEKNIIEVIMKCKVNCILLHRSQLKVNMK